MSKRENRERQNIILDTITPAPVGLLLGGATFLLIFMISTLALVSIKRNEAAMSRLLIEKGNSLIMAMESSLRTGMRSSMGMPLQPLLEEMLASTDIFFITVVTPDGIIVSHSNNERIAELLILDDTEVDKAILEKLNSNQAAKGAVLNMEGQKCFVVYRLFMQDIVHPSIADHKLSIFLGINISAFEIIRQQDRDFVLILASVMLVLGLGTLIVLYYAQRARQSKLSQKQAEVQILALEEEVRRKDKLAAVGILAAGVAHEIRNPLSSIKGYATYFGQRFPPDSEDREAAGFMVREVERLNRVITDLISLSKPSTANPKAMSLKASVDYVLHLIQPDILKNKVQVINKVADDLPLAWLDPDRFAQALLNICLNALEAMPANAGILILKAEQINDLLQLDVIDNGAGIAKEHLAHIFDPYFTTKGQGTGLGLATAHKIMEAMGGEIHVKNNNNLNEIQENSTGTCFSLYLRVAKAK